MWELCWLSPLNFAFQISSERDGRGRPSLHGFADYFFFGFHSPRCAPVGSVIMLSQPMSATGVTSFITLAPSDLAFLVEASMSSTKTYESQNDGAPGIGFFIMPPPVPSPTPIMV